MSSISVIMPVYNAGKFLNKAIISVLNQEFSDFEFIIINDCSSDDTAGILKLFQKRDSRIKIINNRERLGVARSLNRGLALASGSYIARMDGDDLSAVTRLWRQKNHLDCHPGVGIVGSWFRVIDADDKLKWQVNPFCEHEDLVSFSIADNPFCHGSVMGRKEVFNYFKGYDYRLEPAEDYHLWLKVMEKYRVYNIPEYLYKLRIHGDSVSVCESVSQRQQAELARTKAITRRKLDYGKARSFSEDWKERCFYYNYRDLLQDKKVLIYGSGWRKAKTLDLLKKIGLELKGVSNNGIDCRAKNGRGTPVDRIKEIANSDYDYIIIADQSWMNLRDKLLAVRIDRRKLIYSVYTY